MNEIIPIPSLNPELIAIELLPPTKRASIVTGLPYKKWIAWIQGVVNQIQWLYGVFYMYMNGCIYGFWVTYTTYNLGDRVVGFVGEGMYGVYESLSNGNHDIPLSNSNYWYKILSSPVGATERAYYNGQRIILEYALNKYFGTTFRQPTGYSVTGQTPNSDIYIENIDPAFYTFIAGTVESMSSYSSISGSVGVSTVTEDYSTDSYYLFSVNIPVTVYEDLGTSNEQIVSEFVNRYCYLGTFFEIITY